MPLPMMMRYFIRNGPGDPDYPVVAGIGFNKEFYWIFACTYYDWIEPREVRNGYGTNISFRKEAFANDGLFSTNLGSERGAENGQQKTTAEEMELSLRVRQKTGKCIVYDPNVIIRHKVHRFRLTGKYVRRRAFIEGCSKKLIKKISKSNGNGEVRLDTEYELLRRILFRLFPSIVKGFLRNPVIAWRRLYVTATVLLAVGAGYYSYSFRNP